MRPTPSSQAPRDHITPRRLRETTNKLCHRTNVANPIHALFIISNKQAQDQPHRRPASITTERPPHTPRPQSALVLLMRRRVAPLFFRGQRAAERAPCRYLPSFWPTARPCRSTRG